LYITKNQIQWGVKEEMATNLEDILARRTRCLFLDAYETEKIAPKVAETMAKILNKNQNWINQELKDFKSIIKNYQL
jgi:glycerol-3-phosphate dehydrogenase